MSLTEGEAQGVRGNGGFAVYLWWGILEFRWSRRVWACKEKVMLLGKEHLIEQWRGLKASNKCQPDSLGNADLVNDFEQERRVRFTTAWVSRCVWDISLLVLLQMALFASQSLRIILDKSLKQLNPRETQKHRGRETEVETEKQRD